MLFRGLNNVSLDAKGRLGIPARHRETIVSHCQGRLVVTIDNNGECLVIYPLNEFEEIQRKIDSLSSFDPVANRLKHLVIGHATDLELDNSGRVLVPAELREFVGLEKKVVVVGQSRRLELWDEERWNSRREGWLQEGAGQGEVSAQLMNLSL